MMSIKHTLAAAAVAAAGIFGASTATADTVFPDTVDVGYGLPIAEAVYFPAGVVNQNNGNTIQMNVVGTPTHVNFSFESCDLVLGGVIIEGCEATASSTASVPTVTAILEQAGSVVWTDTWEIPFNGGNFDVALAGLSGAYSLTLATGADGGILDIDIQAVPIPAAAILFGTALAGFAGFSARRKAA